MKAKGTYTVKKWEESSYQQMTPESKMTKASVEYLMFYSHFDPKNQHKASASYVGLIYLDGAVSGKSGSIVLQDNGTFEGGTAQSTLRIVKGSGTGQLKGIHGTGMYLANQDGYRFELDYNFE